MTYNVFGGTLNLAQLNSTQTNTNSAYESNRPKFITHFIYIIEISLSG